VVPSSFRKYAIPFFVHMNLKLFSFLNRKHWLKRRRLVLVRLSLINKRALGWSLLWARNRCRLLKTESLILLEQNRAMMVGCRLLSEAGDSLCETLISLADRSSQKTYHQLISVLTFFLGQSLKLKAFTAAILLKVVNILLHLARLSLKLADMIYKVMVLNVQGLHLLICRV